MTEVRIVDLLRSWFTHITQFLMILFSKPTDTVLLYLFVIIVLVHLKTIEDFDHPIGVGQRKAPLGPLWGM